MNDSLLNIINIDDLPDIRKSNDKLNMPKRNTLVTVTILERLINGVKVLIDGKLFIAIINETVASQEELIAWVSDTEKFELSLNLSNQLNSNPNLLLTQIINKLGLTNDISTKVVLAKIVTERKPVVKSKINLLLDFISQNELKLSDSQLSLLINILWNEKGNSTTVPDKISGRELAEELFANLFSEPFEVVCKKLFEATKKIMYTKIPSFIMQQINKTIYDRTIDNTVALGGKKELVIEVVKSLNNYLSTENIEKNKNVVEKYIEYGTKYILQKSALQQYDFYPDFVIAKNEDELILILLEIKKYYSNAGEAFYNIVFKHNAVPMELKGIVRNHFLSGNILMENDKNDKNEFAIKQIENFKQELKQSWDLNSNITLNDGDDTKLNNTYLESGVNAFA